MALINKKHMVKSSGGVIANNFRQGSRAEIIAQYFFSEFCIAERALRENDFGIDLYCSLMNVKGSMGFTSTLFGVQIKSGDAPFTFQGESISDWISSINIPLLMCRVNQDDLNVKVFSTWTINPLISGNKRFTKIEFIEENSTVPGSEKLIMPKVEGEVATVWMGLPIIEYRLPQLITDQELKYKNKDILNDWVSFDFENYSKRHAGITVFFGYTKWKTNETLDSSMRTWYKPHISGPEQSQMAIHRILEATALIAFSQGKEHPFVKGIAELLKANGIVNIDDLDRWQKENIGISS